MDSFAIAFDVSAYSGRSHVDDPFLSSGTVFSLLNKFFILQINRNLAVPNIILVRVYFLNKTNVSLIDLNSPNVMIFQRRVQFNNCRLLFKQLPERDFSLADIKSSVLPFILSPYDELQKIVGDFMGTNVES